MRCKFAEDLCEIKMNVIEVETDIHVIIIITDKTMFVLSCLKMVKTI